LLRKDCASRFLSIATAESALNGKEDPDHCYGGIAGFSTDRAIHNDPAHQSTVERRSFGAAADQKPTQGSLL
jgi:hypothetical protein